MKESRTLAAREILALESFRKTVCAREKTEIGLEDEVAWLDMSYGFFLGKDIPPDRAYELATLVRYRLLYFKKGVVNLREWGSFVAKANRGKEVDVYLPVEPIMPVINMPPKIPGDAA